MPSRLLVVAFALTLLLALAAGCAPAIGDECRTGLDCSQQGSRICDRTQPGGYCTIKGCERGTCPEDSVCVRFLPANQQQAAERLAVTYCMATCDTTSDCRNDEGYRCTGAEEFKEESFGLSEAELLGPASQQFCSIPERMLTTSTPDESTDAAVATDSDAAAADGGTADAATDAAIDASAP